MPNSGFVDVTTIQAGPDNVSVTGLGTLVPGAGPVIGLEGNVFLGTMEGKVTALHPDGTALWNSRLPDDRQIIASPAVGRDGSVYVVGVRPAHPREHRAEFVGRHQATLYKFSKDGAAPLGNAVDFPEHRSAQARQYGPQFIGAHDVWRFGNDEAILVPAAYPTVGGYDLHLLAFGSGGGRLSGGRFVGELIADVTVAYWSGGDVTGEPGFTFIAPFPAEFSPGLLTSSPAHLPLPGVAIYTSPQGGTPLISVANGWHSAIVSSTGWRSEIVGFTFSPVGGFTERFRTRVSDEETQFYSSPTILPDLNTAVGTNEGVMFARPPTAAPPAAITNLGRVYAQPTLAAGNRVMVVTARERTFALAVLENYAVVALTAFPGKSMARAGASRTHVFVSTTEGLHTFDTNGHRLFTLPWAGGISPPAIGPEGHVYVMGGLNTFFVFPPPAQRLRENVGRDLHV